MVFAAFLICLTLFDNDILAASAPDSACDKVTIVSRSEWNARSAMRDRKMNLPVNHVIISHTVTRFCKNQLGCTRIVQLIQDMHLDDRGWWDIGYNFLIGGDGQAYEGRGWSNTGAHAINYNTISQGITFIGNFNKEKPSKAMLNAAQNLIKCGIEKGYISPLGEVHGHRDVACTESPGDYLYAEIRNWDNFRGGRMPYYHCKVLENPEVNKDIVND